MTDLDPNRPTHSTESALRSFAPPVDLAASPAPTTPVSRPERALRPGRSRLRWALALLVTAAVVVGVGAATLLMTGQAGDPDVLAWTPDDTVAYAELRLDLPGDQETELARVLSALPGFDDQAAFSGKLGEALDRLVGDATDGLHDYRTWIDPWFGGELAISMRPPAPGSPAAGAAGQTRALLLASIDDADGAAAWADELLRESGATSTTETYGGIRITIVTPATPADSARLAAAYAVLGPVLAIGDPASVRAAIDTGGNGGLGRRESFRAATASLSGDRLGFAFIDTGALLDAAAAMSDGLGVDGPNASLPPLARDLTPPWIAGSVRAAEGDLVIESRQPHVVALGPATTDASAIAELVPPSTIALATGHDVGAAIERVRGLLADDPTLADGLRQIEDAAGLLGGIGAATGWMGDAGIALAPDGDGVSGGLLITPTDPAAADRLLTTLRSFIGLSGMDLSVRDEAHGDATISIVDLGDLGSFAGGMPTAPTELPSGSIELAWSVTDEVVVLGVGPAFVRAVLDARDGPSLADEPRFSSLLDRAGARHASLTWLDAAGIRSVLERLIPADERAAYELEVEPYLGAFDAVLGTSVPGDDIDRGTIIISMAQ